LSVHIFPACCLAQLRLHEEPSIVTVSEEQVVSATSEPKIVCRCLATTRKRRSVMMNLKKSSRRTASTLGTQKRALPSVAGMNFAQDLPRDVA
jgi:hypothetical protein